MKLSLFKLFGIARKLTTKLTTPSWKTHAQIVPWLFGLHIMDKKKKTKSDGFVIYNYPIIVCNIDHFDPSIVICGI